jgi:hypothetical protein
MLDIRPYLSTLEVAYKNQLDDLMRVQIREYIQFVKNFTEAANIMAKSFFVIVPYTPSILSSDKGIMSKLPWGGGVDAAQENRTFEENLSQLEQRVSVVQQGLIRTGVRTVELGTEEAVELLYKMFNPGDQEKPMNVLEAQAQQ